MSAPKGGYQEKLEREREIYIQRDFQARHLLNSRLFFSVERNEFNYSFARTQMARLAGQLAARNGCSQPKVLVAPVGAGFDLPFLEPVSGDLTGLDISAEAIASILQPGRTKLIVGDLKRMDMFETGCFDLVITSLFYHHFTGFGYDDFLRETLRVLRPGGYLVALEPSALHPVHWLTWLGRRIFGNITGTVVDEAPLRPARLVAAMRHCGFRDVRVSAASFSHHRLPVWIAKINNVVTQPFANVPLARGWAWTCLFHGRK
jgi:SAM-dependent methyltransferase